MSLKGFSSSGHYQALLVEIGLIKEELSAILREGSDITELYRAQGGIKSLDILEGRIEMAEHEPETGTEPDYR